PGRAALYIVATFLSPKGPPDRRRGNFAPLQTKGSITPAATCHCGTPQMTPQTNRARRIKALSLYASPKVSDRVFFFYRFPIHRITGFEAAVGAKKPPVSVPGAV